MEETFGGSAPPRLRVQTRTDETSADLTI